MTYTRKLVSAVCLALLCLSCSVSNAQVVGVLDPTQTYLTDNIVQPTVAGSGTTPWVNGVYQDQLTCWAGGNPGYCGPNPIIRPGDMIHFSYGSSYIYQQQAVSGLLPNSGNGLQVNGYIFSFTAKNGNGWDDGRVDNLTALVRFWDTTGGRGTTNLLEKGEYNLTYKFNWTPFSFNETFTTPLSATSIGQVQYGFLGKDNNGWAGPYGPEIHSVNFKLKYSVDACSVDPMSSSKCPGYYDAISKYTIPAASTLSTSVQAPVATVTTTPTQPTAVESVPATSSSSSTPVATSSTATVTATPTATNPQPKAGEVTVAGAPAQASKSSSGPSLSTILNIVGNEQSRVSNVEKSVVEQTTTQAASASQSAQKEAEAVAATLTSQSTAASMSQTTSTRPFGPASYQVGQSALQASQSSSMGSGVGLQVGGGLAVASVTQSSFSQLASFASREVEQPRYEIGGGSLGGKSALDTLIENNQMLVAPATNVEQRFSTVNRNAADNEAAGGVDINTIAKQPAGYNQYFIALQDTAFYAPKEIYRNQTNVDNARALRLLSSDKLHQQMIDQQYR